MPELDDGAEHPLSELDLDSPAAILAEIQATANSDSRWGIRGEQATDRIREAARVSFLASRLIWLESSRMSVRRLDAATRP